MAEHNTPKVVVGAIILNTKGEMFLATSYKWKNEWVVPGGHLELGEALDDAIRREVKEETNLDIHKIEFAGVQERIFPKEYIKKKHFIFLDFCCEAKTDDVKLNSELQKYIWIKPEDATQLNLNPGTRKCIEMFINKKNR